MVPLRVRPVTPSLALWRSGLAHLPPKEKVIGSNPIRASRWVGVAQWESTSLVTKRPGSDSRRRLQASGARAAERRPLKPKGGSSSLLARTKDYAPLAQRREERLPYKQKVPSSQLGRGTRMGSVV